VNFPFKVLCIFVYLLAIIFCSPCANKTSLERIELLLFLLKLHLTFRTLGEREACLIYIFWVV